jgi:hypothetical protein
MLVESTRTCRRLLSQVLDWQRLPTLGRQAAVVLSRPETSRAPSVTARRRLTARRRPSIPPRQPFIPPQHPSTRSHAPPPSVCICIARTITRTVDTSKSRTGALVPARSPGVPSKKPCAPSQTLCAPSLLPRSPHSACGCSAAEARAQAAPGRAPLAGIHAPPSLSGLSATKLGVSPTVPRAPAVFGGAPCAKARVVKSQGGVRRAMRSARQAQRAIGRPN